MKEYNGFEYVRTYGPGERFPANPDFTHLAPGGDDSWDAPESISKAWPGLNASTAVYRKISNNPKRVGHHTNIKK